ncbi:MAG: VCBS repeat-containing protein [Planctomycetes bacterium]|nr:VCBS repeat-containing protein [Planctomycetota bacterium]
MTGAAAAQGFQPPLPSPVGTAPIYLHAADLNGDGICDVFLTASADCRTMTGLAGGGFSLGMISPLNTAGGRTALADVDGDGALDLVRNSNLVGTQVAIHKGDGSGGFAASAYQLLGSTAFTHGTNPAVADINADGIPDIVHGFLNSASATQVVSAWLGVGGGLFDGGYASTIQFAFLQPNPRSLALGDFNDDGVVDAALQGTQLFLGGFIVHLPGQSDGNFASPISFLPCPDGFGHLEVADLSGDLREDLLFGGNAPSGLLPSTVGIALGSVAGPFSSHLAVASFPAGALVGTWIGGLAIGDVTADGRPDAVFTATSLQNLQPQLHVAAGSAGGIVIPSTPTPLLAPGFLASDLVIGDFDLDGRNDVIVGMPNATLIELRGTAPTASSVSIYGAGTPGCRGMLSVSAASTPQVGNAQYGHFFTNAPPSSLGLFMATDSQDLAGSDPFGLNILLHIDFFGAAEIVAADIVFDGSGQGFVATPIPSMLSLAGMQYFVQVLALEKSADGFTCNNPSFGLSTSRALHVTVAP